MPRACLAVLALAGASGCGSIAPPASQMPNGQAAIDRMKAAYDCARGVHGDAKIDYFSDKGRVRGSLLFFAVEPALVRMDVVSPFGVTLSTLASDSQHFSLNDLAAKRFLEGPASPCNIARVTHVPIPAHALVSLLHGAAPVLVHEQTAPTVSWSGKGYYVVSIPSKNDAIEELHLAPPKDDFGKPWSDQRLRVLDVVVKQKGVVLYHAELEGHEAAPMSTPLLDDDGIDPPVPPSGPQCSAEVPKKIHVEVPTSGDDVLFRYEEAKLNPPLVDGTFTQPIPGGVERIRVGVCDR
jgi:hypothetical protein